jgi:hypothetical protein
MKAYISLPISGTNDYLERSLDAEFNIIERFKVKKLINPCNCWRSIPWTIKFLFIKYLGTEEQLYRHYLVDDIKKLMECDTIFMMKGWELSKGCRIEHHIAFALGMQVIEEGDNWKGYHR